MRVICRGGSISGEAVESTMRPPTRSLLLQVGALAGLSVALFDAQSGVAAANVTQCTALGFCYCVNASLQDSIDANVTRVRQVITDQRALGKAIGYLSIPLSTSGGGYFGVNRDVAKGAKDQLERRFGSNSVWILNPGAEGSLPAGASGADYMLMWTKILEGPSGLGEQFDFFYFAGPSDFSRFFNFDGDRDMEKVDAAFDRRLADDPGLRQAVDQNKLSKRSFRNYYALRASVAFSYGSHDEWNIARLLNERRRGAADFGISNQLAILFDGRAVDPAALETADATGDVGRCIN
jgi:hypothetical protein